MEIKRATAKICPLQALIQGEYVLQEGWEPNYVLVGQEKIVRINIIGLVVQKVNNFSFFIDDGTSSIRVTDFTQSTQTKNLAVGDPVLVIGRPRKANDELFIASEIVQSKQLKETPSWLSFRQAQLEVYTPHHTPELPPPSSSASPEPNTEELISFIRKKDTGEGCPVQEIIDYYGTAVEDTLTLLLSMGEIYEIRSGMIKVLE